MMRHTSRRLGLGLVLFVSIWCNSARGQIVPRPPLVGGVYIDPDGTVRHREADAKGELARIRAQMRTGSAGAKDEKLAFVSLPKAFAEARELAEAGKEIPESLRYLGGLTQVRYVLAYPEERDLVIVGPAEPWDATNPLQPIGKKTGRPVLQMDDLVVAMRLAEKGRRGLGCTLEPRPDALERAKEVQRRVGNNTRELVRAMPEALGPQRVDVIGVGGDTRLAFVCVAADYRLKRMTLGIEPPPVPGIGNAVDNTRAAGNRFWFEVMYEPLLASPDGNAFEVRGPRLQLKCGTLNFDDRGATPRAVAFTKQFSQKIPQLAAAVPLFADLQNVADVMLLACLIEQDDLDQRVQWDRSWVTKPGGYAVPTVAVPRSAETLVHLTSGSLAAGGVSLKLDGVVAKGGRKVEEDETMLGLKRALPKMRERSENPAAVVVTQP